MSILAELTAWQTAALTKHSQDLDRALAHDNKASALAHLLAVRGLAEDAMTLIAHKQVSEERGG